MAIAIDDLKKRRHILIVDVTGSMSEPVSSNNPQSRIAYAAESTLAVSRAIMELQPEGFDFYTFNEKFRHYPRATPDTVRDVFARTAPVGGTDFLGVLKDALKIHFDAGDRPSTILMVTDGNPNVPTVDDARKAVANLITASAARLESDAELGIGFFQVGQDPNARQFLKTLDDDLQRVYKAKFDIVSTLTFDELAEKGITAALLSAVNE